MKLKLTAALLAMGASMSAAHAAYNALVLANELGNVLAAEELCGLTFDQPAIAAFIEKRVPADDMSFAGFLQMQVDGIRMGFADMSASQKTAHCTQIRRVAKSYGFLN
ncbi:hypothetical protein [Mesorhizobium sp. 1M-11]|uniref:hypothetical protein n=1 Tax=Mesorhizobium sp. 1M-11 TaxID=1529006 RepID=UPI0006C741CB|nr:hypothetical protein [Mesorhizobium sp. 1M-11]